MKLLCATPLHMPAPGGTQRHLRDIVTRLMARGRGVNTVIANTPYEGDFRRRMPLGLPARHTS